MGIDRRYRERTEHGPLMLLCRECFSPIELRPQRLTIEDGRACYRCQRCELSFVVRGDDVAMLATAGPAPAED